MKSLTLELRDERVLFEANYIHNPSNRTGWNKKKDNEAVEIAQLSSQMNGVVPSIKRLRFRMMRWNRNRRR